MRSAQRSLLLTMSSYSRRTGIVSSRCSWTPPIARWLAPVPRSESFERRADLGVLCTTLIRRRRRGTHHFSDGSGGAGAWNGSSGRRRILSGSLVRLGAANWCSRIIEVRRVIVPVPVYGCERLQAGLALCH